MDAKQSTRTPAVSDNRAAQDGTGEAAGRRSQTTRAYQEIRRRILENEMPADSQYLEQELADALGMSRTPVREALIRLSEERLVEVKPRHGARVLPVSIDDMREIYEVLTELEGVAARKVAERGLEHCEIGRLQQAVDDMDAALACDDLDAWAKSDARFHRLLVGLAGNSRLAQIVATISDQAHRVRMLTLRSRPKPVASNRDHAALVEAIRDGDGEKAYEIHWNHRAMAGAMLLDILARNGGHAQ
jgi:DNA-binding GntR family transcriptional regulator